MAASPDLEGLTTFAERGDREPSPFFAGRTKEIVRVADRCVLALTRVTEEGNPLAGATLLFQGAPGVGKSALLSEMEGLWIGEREWQRGTAPPPVLPVPVKLSATKVLDSEEAVVRAILDAAAPEVEAAAWTTRTAGASVGVGGPVLKADVKLGSAAAPRPLLFDDMTRYIPADAWLRPVCLMVDEIQDANAAAKDVLQALHLGVKGLPVVPVLAGLGSSADRLHEIGVSRPSRKSTFGLGALSSGDVSDAVTAMFDAFHVVGTEDLRRDWVRWLGGCSEGWAQHLHNGMCALAEELAKTNGRLADVDGAAVAGLEAGWREESYMGRISRQMNSARRLVAGLLAGLPGDGGWAQDDTEWEIGRLAREHGGRAPGWALPDGMTPQSFFSHLVHKGVFHQDPETRSYSCPIPSLRTRLVEYGQGGEPAPEEPEHGSGAPYEP